MGICCGSKNTRVSADKVAHQLPLPELQDEERERIGEAFLALRERLPFAYTHLNFYAKQLRSLGKDAFEIDEMKELFSVIGKWQQEELWADESEFKELMAKLPGSDGASVKLESALCLGFLLCQADDYNKAEFLFELLQDPESQS